jgi:tetratricopeptide (TPR) repeat protein
MPGLLAAGAAAWLAIPAAVFAAPVDDAVAELQCDWETTRYRAPPPERGTRFEVLAEKAYHISANFTGRSEPLVWECIIVSSLACEKGGLGALGLVRQAKAIYKQAIRLDGQALDGSANNSLGVLCYKVPGWPLGFGDNAKAKDLLQKALALNPRSASTQTSSMPTTWSKWASPKPPCRISSARCSAASSGRQIADAGRRDEVRALLGKLKTTP